MFFERRVSTSAIFRPWALLVGGLCVLAAVPAAAQNPACPDGANLPQLTIRQVDDEKNVVPVIDGWQVFLDDVALSDAQLARMSGSETLIERTHEEMRDRGAWVYIGLGVSAFGTAVSSAGWVLYGQNNPTGVSQSITLTMAIGGVVVGLLGVLSVTEAIQRPLEPHLAPTPQHRLTLREVEQLIAALNERIRKRACGLPIAPLPIEIAADADGVFSETSAELSAKEPAERVDDGETQGEAEGSAADSTTP